MTSILEFNNIKYGYIPVPQCFVGCKNDCSAMTWIFAMLFILLLGPDILCWSSDLFPKDPGTGKVCEWHQDATYVGKFRSE